jgi:hypothetical protein
MRKTGTHHPAILREIAKPWNNTSHFLTTQISTLSAKTLELFVDSVMAIIHKACIPQSFNLDWLEEMEKNRGYQLQSM